MTTLKRDAEFERTLAGHKAFVRQNRARINAEWDALKDPTREPISAKIKAQSGREWRDM